MECRSRTTFKQLVLWLVRKGSIASNAEFPSLTIIWEEEDCLGGLSLRVESDTQHLLEREKDMA